MKSRHGFYSALVAILALTMFSMSAHATTPSKRAPENIVKQSQGQDQLQGQVQAQGQIQGQQTEVAQAQQTVVDTDTTVITTNSSSALGFGGASEATADNQGVSLSSVQNYEAGVPDTVLVPNNNTAACISVLGISAAGKNGSGMLGIPMPEKFLWWETQVAACNYEAAADDAFAGGERELGWFWKCHQKTLYRSFKKNGIKKDAAIIACTTKMIGGVTNVATISRLRNNIELLLTERDIDREVCNESKSRILEGCTRK